MFHSVGIEAPESQSFGMYLGIGLGTSGVKAVPDRLAILARGVPTTEAVVIAEATDAEGLARRRGLFRGVYPSLRDLFARSAAPY